MSDLIKSKILEVIEKIGSEKFATIILDNASAVAATHQKISNTYFHIINIHCIAHFVNLISKDILGGELKNYCKIQWTLNYETVSSVTQL
ncbi:hypothetical protein RhiirA4_457336 [Rhizophagus irregularis]|uniref:DUF659 domain-containing protein n=1 Tax=Rhizophagus irregularis TaxID=588596 RepID=A0A2I1G9S3_9GLOM|nr:hypothetical protein RhiirA4_457336 [Rhizophagus irregularis]